MPNSNEIVAGICANSWYRAQLHASHLLPRSTKLARKSAQEQASRTLLARFLLIPSGGTYALQVFLDHPSYPIDCHDGGAVNSSNGTGPARVWFGYQVAAAVALAALCLLVVCMRTRSGRRPHDRIRRAFSPARERDRPGTTSTPHQPAGFQNSAAGPDLGFYAARSYSLMRPPRTGRRWIRSWERSAAGWSGRGGQSCRLR